MIKVAKKKLLILDGNALVHRAFHALPKQYQQNQGFRQMLFMGLSLFYQGIKDIKPTHIAICFDVSKNF